MAMMQVAKDTDGTLTLVDKYKMVLRENSSTIDTERDRYAYIDSAGATRHIATMDDVGGSLNLTGGRADEIYTADQFISGGNA